jgi:hypothetical protein
MTQIASEAGVGYATLKLFWPQLKKEKIVIQTRIIGRAKMYKLNNKNSIVKKFNDFYWATTKYSVRNKAKMVC